MGLSAPECVPAFRINPTMPFPMETGWHTIQMCQPMEQYIQYPDRSWFVGSNTANKGHKLGDQLNRTDR